MEILIAGGTGFIGQALVQHYLKNGINCTIVGRSTAKIQQIFANQVSALSWDELLKQDPTKLRQFALIINLTGASIGEKRWSDSRRKEILQSRLQATQQIANLCAKLGATSPPLFNASAVGIYGLQSPAPHGLPMPLTEDQPLDFTQFPDFLAEVGRKWELATQAAELAGVRVVKLRFGVVLGKNGGALKKLTCPFLLGLGGPIGSGAQPFSWVALVDLIRAIDFLLPQQTIHGPVNIVAPQCVTQREFARTLAKVLHRPSLLPMPTFMVKILFGQMGEELLLRGQHAIPHVLQKLGFVFEYPDLASALQAIFRK